MMQLSDRIIVPTIHRSPKRPGTERVPSGTRLRMEDWPQLDGGGTVWHFTKARVMASRDVVFVTTEVLTGRC